MSEFESLAPESMKRPLPKKFPKKPRPEFPVVKLTPSKQKDAKWTVKIQGGKTVNFGQKGASDFTLNNDTERQKLYIGRHEKRESQFWDSDQENLETASFWSRYLLWDDPDIFETIPRIEEKMKCKIQFTKNTVARHQRKLAKLAVSQQDDEV